MDADILTEPPNSQPSGGCRDVVAGSGHKRPFEEAVEKDLREGPVFKAMKLSTSTPPQIDELNSLYERSASPSYNDSILPTSSNSELTGSAQASNSNEDEQPQLPVNTLLPLNVLPHIWAQSRQEVCESFDWFRSYQSGVYFVNNTTKGYLLSGFPAKRDGFYHDGKLIISHGGGKAESLQQYKGILKMKAAENQKAEDKSVRSLLTNFHQRIPLVLLIDDKYARFPYDLGGKNIAYAVLGVYYITHAWAEYETTKSNAKCVRYKFAFQWCEEQDPPWWHSSKEQPSSSPIEVPPLIEPHFEGQDSDTSFEYSDSSRTTETDYEDLVLSDDKNASPIIDTVNQSPSKFPRRIPAKKTEFLLSERAPGSTDRMCPHCNSRSPTVFAVGWGCLNSSCPCFWTLPEQGGVPFPDDLEYSPDFLNLLPLPSLDSGFRDIRPRPPVTAPTDKITTVPSFARGMHCVKCGRLSCRSNWQHWECANCQHVLPVSGRIRRANELKDLPTVVPFQANFVMKGSGIDRTSGHGFKTESGFAARIQTFQFPDGKGKIHHITSASPLANQRADDLFREYQEQASDGRLPFKRWPLRNFEGHFSRTISPKIARGEPYHYVGGTANTLSWDEAPQAVVGARQLIIDRIQQASGECHVFNEVLSAAYMEKQKMSFHTDDEKGLGEVVAGLSLGAPALMHFRRRDVKHGPERRTCLSIVLRHGDILVMYGAGVQKYYEHMVEPTNFRIAATARYIDPNRN